MRGGEGGRKVSGESSGLNPGIAVETAGLEYTQGSLNSWCSGELLRYHEDDSSRRQVSGVELTLRLESAGIKQD